MAATSNNDIARAIYLATRGKAGVEQSDVLRKVVNFLSRKRLLSKSDEILSRLDKMINQEEGRVIAKVSSPEKLDSRMKTHLEQELKKRYRANEIVLREIFNKELIGGIKVEVNDEIIDLSIKNRIGKLQAYLIKD